MENFTLIISVLFTHFLAWLTPGPLFVLIIRNSVVYSRKAGIFTAVGFAIGNVIHITVAITGVAIIISGSATASSTIKFLGVSYLVYLGIKTLFMKIQEAKLDSSDKQNDISTPSAIKMGFLANILSVGAYLFFGSIFAGVLSSDVPRWVVAVLFMVMPLNTLFMATILSIFFTQNRIKSVYIKFQSILNRCLGGALILLATIIAFS